MTISSIVPCSGTGSCTRNEFEARESSDLALVLARSVALPSLISAVNAGVAGSENGTLGSKCAPMRFKTLQESPGSSTPFMRANLLSIAHTME